MAEFFVVEDGVGAGDVVGIGPNDISYNSSNGLQKTSVLKKATPEDRAVGVVSTNPFQVMNRELNDQRPSDTQPIAMSGTTLVKVSTANGPIKKGDLLAASNIPGVAVRTDKAGQIIGSALENYDGSETSTDKILMFISTTYSTGARTNAVLSKYGVNPEDIPSTVDMGRLLLAQMLSHKQEITASSTLSEIYTDRIMAGLEVISPRVLTGTLVTDVIEPFDKNVTFKLTEGGKLIFIRAGPGQMSTSFGSIGPPATSTPILTIDDIGNAVFSGGITIGSRDRPNGITLYDTETKEPYCVKITKGALVNVPGECSLLTDLMATSTPSAQPSSEQTTTASPLPIESSVTVATTTTSAEPITATTTIEASASTPIETTATTTTILEPTTITTESTTTTTVTEPTTTSEPTTATATTETTIATESPPPEPAPAPTESPPPEPAPTEPAPAPTETPAL